VLPGRTCSVDAECGNLRCDPLRRQCICLSDSDCPAGADGSPQYCSNFTGLCVASVPGCKSDADCATGQFCNPETRGCQDLRSFCETCNSDTECGAGNHCLSGGMLGQSFCSKACTAQTDCPQGTTCTQVTDGDSQCEPNPGTTCKTFTGCTPDSHQSCNSSNDCTAGTDQVCDTGSGTCRARVSICALGTVCDPSLRVCVNSCSTDQDCSSDGSLACVNHICQPLSTCQSDSECPTDKVCDLPSGSTQGHCVPTCTSDTACSTGRVCQPVIEADGSTRNSCLPGCVHDTDCAPDQICADPSTGQKFVPSGTALGQCASTLNGTQACQATDACGSCQVCASSNVCQAPAPASGQSIAGYCHPCATDNDCTGFAANATCIILDGRNPDGSFIDNGLSYCAIPCAAGSGVGIAGTADNAVCPRGFVCASLVDGQGVPTGNFACAPSTFDCATAGCP